MKYIGIKMPSNDLINPSKGNYGDIWEKQKNGNYTCKGRNFIMNEEQIQSDVRNGYLKKYTEPKK